MDTFWTITIFSLINAFLPRILDFLMKFQYVLRPGYRHLHSQLFNLKAELSSLDMVDDFANYVRIQRKIAQISDKLSKNSTGYSTLIFIIKWTICGSFYLFYGLLIAYYMWNYSKESLITIPGEWYFPLGYFLAIPCGGTGALGLTSWLVIVNSVAKYFYKKVC